MTTVRIQDLRAAGFCNHGAREFFKQHDCDWYDFLQNGVDADKALATNDANAALAVEYARKRERETNDGC